MWKVLQLLTIATLLLANSEATYDCITGCACEKIDDKSIADCSRHNFTEIPQPEDYQITDLLLQYNQITIIQSDAFDFYNKLKRASLRINSIDTIEPGAFEGLRVSNIESLDLSFNRIRSIPVNELRQLRSSLRKLSLAHNALRTIPVGISAMEVLEDLDLSYNSFISDIPVGSLPSSLVKLNLQNTKVSTFRKGAFVNLKSLQILILSDIAYRSVNFDKNVFGGLTNLRYIDLSGCFCKRLPKDSFTALRNLETLLLRNCYLTQIPKLAETNVIEATKHDMINRKKRNVDENLKPQTDVTDSNVTTTTTWYNPNLQTIDLSHNRLITVTPESAKFPPSVTSINLRSTSVRDVSDQLFAHVPNVRTLNLCRSRIKSISDNAFVHLSSAIEICLSENPITKPPILPASITALNLTNVKITNLTKPFLAHLNQVKEANFQNGIVEFIEDMTFIAQGELTVLNISGNNVRVITKRAIAMGDYEYNPFTETLVLSNNGRISKRSINAMSKLLHLDLSHNAIEEIQEDAFSTHSQLLTLQLQGNYLNEITEHTFLGLRKLEILQLKDNNLDYLAPHSLRHLDNLKVLDLQNNNLEIIHTEFFQAARNLEQLYLQNNGLILFHPISVPNLLYVDFSNNNVTSFPVITAPRLQFMRALRNPIENLPLKVFKGLPNLKHLDLRVLRLSYLNYSIFQYTKKLEFLDVSNNFIANFIDQPIPSLEEFRISENEIVGISQPLSETVPMIHNLLLSFNNITYLYPDTFAGSRTLRSLDLSGNNLYCDCRMQPFVNWVEMEYQTGDVDIINADEYMCEGPPEMYTNLVIHAVADLDCHEPTPAPSKIGITGLAVGITVAITFFIIILISLLLRKRCSSSQHGERLNRPSATSTSISDETENSNHAQAQESKIWCCVPCKKWLAKDSFRDRMFSSHSRTEEQGLMTTTTSTTPTESNAPPIV